MNLLISGSSRRRFRVRLTLRALGSKHVKPASMNSHHWIRSPEVFSAEHTRGLPNVLWTAYLIPPHAGLLNGTTDCVRPGLICWIDRLAVIDVNEGVAVPQRATGTLSALFAEPRSSFLSTFASLRRLEEEGGSSVSVSRDSSGRS